jgi:(R,R)-butanediol dehydrogenase/meso-butanediol dehydrogenase/diacetyl reductase
METMDALRWHGARDLRLEAVPRPEKPGAGFAIVDVAYCGICGSDLSEYRDGPKLIRDTPHPLTGQASPVTMGHEFAGRIAAASDERRWPAGMRVTADACWRCGTCEACVAGVYNRCRYGGSIGLHSDGAFAARLVVPEYCLVAIPDAVPDTHAALTEPLAVALHALARGGAKAGDEALVLGFGPIGASAAMLARGIGLRVIVVELDDPRRASAEAMGFETVDAGDDLPRRVRSITATGGVDVVLESTGSSAILGDAVECARRGGRIVLVGLSGEPSNVLASRLVLFERSLVGSLGYHNDLPRVMRMMELGVIDPEVLISDIVPLASACDIIGDLAAQPGGRIKVLVQVSS